MDQRKTVLVVDDDPMIREVVGEGLSANHDCRFAESGTEAIAAARMSPRPDLIMLDITLPDMDGYDVCRELKEDPATAEIPIIFLSSHTNVSDVTTGLNLGAVDYVTKPVAMPIVCARVQTHLRLTEARDLLQNQNAHLENMVALRTRDLERKTADLQMSQDLTICALGSVAETRDSDTGNHIHRTRAYVKALMNLLATSGKYRDAARDPDWEMIWKFAPLHDLGKVGIPDSILMKRGRLSPEEFEVMKLHTTYGRDALKSAESRAGGGVGFFRVAIEIAYAHHEKWDGSGYPEALAGSAIPLSARLMAMADVYDALISKRVYKSPVPHQEAVDVIREQRGRHFDPDITDCFMDATAEFHLIANQFSDTN